MEGVVLGACGTIEKKLLSLFCDSASVALSFTPDSSTAVWSTRDSSTD